MMMNGNDDQTTVCKYCGEQVPNLLPARRPATEIEIEAMGAICKLQDELEEARKIIRDLLVVFPTHAFPEKFNDAKNFLIKHKPELQELQEKR
jgi:hypothetical protein